MFSDFKIFHAERNKKEYANELWITQDELYYQLTIKNSLVFKEHFNFTIHFECTHWEAHSRLARNKA